jgi:RNA polymerase sigma factor (sigma-70 family)
MMRAPDDPGQRRERPDFVELVKLARDGDAVAKHGLVDALERLVWHSVADFGMSREDRQDVFVGTFCRLFEQIERDKIREPERLPGWIATTARNEAKTMLRARGRLVPSDEMGEREDTDPPTDARLLGNELGAALQLAFQRLSSNCRDLLRLATAVPRLSYEEIGDRLDMPHGSIGPTRQRCLERLRNTPELRPFLEGAQP